MKNIAAPITIEYVYDKAKLLRPNINQGRRISTIATAVAAYSSLASFLRTGCVPAPFRSMMVTRLNACIAREERRLRRLWPARNIVRMSRIVDDSRDPMAGAAVQGKPLCRRSTSVVVCTRMTTAAMWDDAAMLSNTTKKYKVKP